MAFRERVNDFLHGKAEFVSLRDGSDMRMPGGYWEIPSAEGFDVPQGVSDVAALTSLDEPARQLAERLLDPNSDLSDLNPPALEPGETVSDRVTFLGSKLVDIIQSHKEKQS